MTDILQLFKTAEDMGISCKQMGEPTKSKRMMWTTQPPYRYFIGNGWQQSIKYKGITKKILKELKEKTGFNIVFRHKDLIILYSS